MVLPSDLSITLRHFRCWDLLSLKINLGSITLIKGSSGIGKTTILQAITWCLYGNIRQVTPNHDEKAKTSVNISLPYNYKDQADVLSITRHKNPNRLLVNHGPNTYEDKVAQSLIDEIFGAYDIWLASCYIGQGCRNTFLTAPNSGKMELLNSIAFHEEDPTFFINKIDEQITLHDQDYKYKLGIFTGKLQNFQLILNQTDVHKALTPEQILSLKQYIQEKNIELHNLQQIKVDRDVTQRLLSNLQSQLLSLKIPQSFTIDDSTLLTLNAKYQGLELNNLPNIETNLHLVTDVVSKLQRRDDLSREVIHYSNLLKQFATLDISQDYDVNDYHKAMTQESAHHENKKIAQNLGITYDSKAINDKINEYQHLLNIQEYLKLFAEQKQLEHTIQILEQENLLDSTPLAIPEIVPIDIPQPNYDQYNTESLQKELDKLLNQQGSMQAHIQHLLQNEDILQCPQCSGSLRYQNGKLVSAQEPPISKSELSHAHSQLKQITNNIVVIRKQIDELIKLEKSTRFAYEQNVLAEQTRVHNLKEKIRCVEMEQHKRNIKIQQRTENIFSHTNRLNFIAEQLSHVQQQLTGKLLTEKEIFDIHSLIGKLKTVVIVDLPPISSKNIQDYLNYKDILRKKTETEIIYQNYINNLDQIFRLEPVSDLNIYIELLRLVRNKMKTYVEETMRFEENHKNLSQQIVEAELRLTNTADPTSTINDLIIDLKQKEEMLILSEKAQNVLQQQKELDKEREDIENLNMIARDLHILRQHAVDMECQVLQQIVDSINNSIESVCQTLFDKDINVSLSLFKQMKTTKHVKPVANFKISYQGGEFDNISQLSGGEGDRASLALTLALNKISTSPILMLDESLAALDLNMKEAAIRTIKENINNTVLVIMHDGIEGIFDDVVDIDALR